MKKAIALLAGVAAAVGAMAGTASADDTTVVPGQQGRTGTVTGKYTEVKTYLDQGIEIVCVYQVQYRGDFGLDPYLDNGWIINNIRCDDGSRYHYLMVHNTDPRYTGNPARALWGTWEWVVLTVSGTGNVANPMHPAYDF